MDMELVRREREQIGFSPTIMEHKAREIIVRALLEQRQAERQRTIIKLAVITTTVIIACALMTGCATTQSLTGLARPAITYSCSLDKARCSLIASAAAESTANGFPVVEVRAPTEAPLVQFLPGSAESVWAGACDVERMGWLPVTKLCGPPAIYSVGLTYWVNIVPGALYRKSDFVVLIEDDVFGVVRKEMGQ